MEKQSLHKALISLHEELSQTKSLDAVSKELLNTLLKDIQTLLESTEVQTPTEDDNVLHHLKEATEHFEETHPQLTLALDNVLNALHRMGI
jgi:CO dehydrogenase/acetyl-CoA synthase beta subunit